MPSNSRLSKGSKASKKSDLRKMPTIAAIAMENITKSDGGKTPDPELAAEDNKNKSEASKDGKPVFRALVNVEVMF